MSDSMIATPHLDRLRRTFKRVVAIGALVAACGAVLAALLPAHVLPAMLTISVVGIWLAMMGFWGEKKVDRARQNRSHQTGLGQTAK
jgi:uncharacterized membrane protein YfcA